MRSKLLLTSTACLALWSLSGVTTAAKANGRTLYTPASSWSVSHVADNKGTGNDYCAMAQRYSRDVILTFAKNIHNESSLALDFQKQANVRLVDGVENMEVLEQLLSNHHTDEMYENALTESEFSHFCEAVRLLPVQCRKVFVLKKVYGYSQREIAAQLNLSESTVEKHISTGIKRCTLFMRKTQNKIIKGSATSSQSIPGGTYE